MKCNECENMQDNIILDKSFCDNCIYKNYVRKVYKHKFSYSVVIPTKIIKILNLCNVKKLNFSIENEKIIISKLEDV